MVKAYFKFTLNETKLSETTSKHRSMRFLKFSTDLETSPFLILVLRQCTSLRTVLRRCWEFLYHVSRYKYYLAIIIALLYSDK